MQLINDYTCPSEILTLGCVFDDVAGQKLWLSKFWVIMEDAMIYDMISAHLSSIQILVSYRPQKNKIGWVLFFIMSVVSVSISLPVFNFINFEFFDHWLLDCFNTRKLYHNFLLVVTVSGEILPNHQKMKSVHPKQKLHNILCHNALFLLYLKWRAKM